MNRRRPRAVLAATFVLAAGFLWSAGVSAAVTAEQRQQINKVEGNFRAMLGLIRQKKYDEAGKLFEETQQMVAALSSSNDLAVKRLASSLVVRLNAGRRRLTSHGLTLSSFPEPSAPPKPGDQPKLGVPEPIPASNISFAKHVAPIFVKRCRNCHIDRASGKFSVATYTALMQGIGGAAVVEKGDSKRSLLMEILLKGEMPKGGGGKLTNEQLTGIAKWIDEGAKFDGDNVQTPLASLVPQVEKPKLAVATATGKETVKFSRDIAPVITEQCLSCHSGGRPQARLSLANFESILKGSRENVIISPGKPADSLLIKKLKGTADGQRMPLRKAPLSPEVITKFEKWIAEGARFDGPSPTMATEQVARIYKASQMSHEELAAERLALAGKNWKLGNPDVAPDKFENHDFLLLGNVGEDRLKEIGKVAEQQQAKVASILQAPAGKPLLKGRLTLFVFNKRWQYSEYGTMVEKRAVPENWQGHWNYTIVDAYACIYPPQFEEDGSLDSLVAEQLAGAYLDSLGGLPRWFAQGSAWTVASRIDAKDPRVVKWNAGVAEAAREMTKPDDFLGDKLSPEARSVLNYSFAKYLMGRAGEYRKLLGLVHDGAEFDKAFVQAYHGTPQQLAAAWAPKALR